MFGAYLDDSSEGGAGKAAVYSVSPTWPDRAVSSPKLDGFEPQTQLINSRVFRQEYLDDSSEGPTARGAGQVAVYSVSPV